MLNKALAALLILTAICGMWETHQANKWEAKYDALGYSYAQAALTAQEQAKAKEQADLANLQKQTDTALQQAIDAKAKADKAKTAYEAKLALAAKEGDLGHKCSGVQIPKELIP